MIRTARTSVLLIVGVTAIAVSVDATEVGHAAPLTDAEWVAYRNRIRSSESRGDFKSSEEIARDLYVRCRGALAATHPDTSVAEEAVFGYRQLQGLGEETKREYVAASTARFRAWQTIDRTAAEVLPSVHAVRRLMATFQMCSRSIPAEIPNVSLPADCDGGIARTCAFARMFGEAESFWARARACYFRLNGLEIHGRAIELGLAAILCEQSKEASEQVALLQANIDFADRHQLTDRIAWWKERAMTQLAETYYRHGNRQEANRLYAEVRSRLPEDSDHDLVGWCKSWCDRHEARQLMEKGDWDAAYEKILQARVGTIDYGHRNLSKGLTMERILRMSAEIQRKRGNHKEADEDEEYADLIARHAAKLRTAVEAELRKLQESEVNTAPQPLPAPSS